MEQTSARMMIFLMDLEVFRQMIDPVRQKRYLHFGASRVAGMSCEFGDDLRLYFLIHFLSSHGCYSPTDLSHPPGERGTCGTEVHILLPGKYITFILKCKRILSIKPKNYPQNGKEEKCRAFTLRFLLTKTDMRYIIEPLIMPK